jgi:plasmid stabilization system protein ParE
MVRRIRIAAGRLAGQPQMGCVVPEYDDPRIRELIVAPYRVIYRYDAERNLVSVLAVIHGRRMLPPLRE